MINQYIDQLIEYGISTALIDRQNTVFIRNALLKLLGLDDYQPVQATKQMPLENILKAILDFACEKGLIQDNQTSRDLFDTAIMGILTPYPSEVIKKFWSEYEQSPQKATQFFYKLCQDSDYIRRYRMAKDMHWVTDTEYGPLEITINLAKPEKDPKEIAMAKEKKAGGYPECLLCPENEGYAGHAGHPARQNLRIIPVDIAGEDWGLQYSPYVYYNEHCIVLNQKHVPMVIDKAVFRKLFCFMQQFPHYFVGSNADLPIVGGSILSHEHFQGGRHCFPLEKAPIEKHYIFKGFEDVEAGVVKWPMSVIRLIHDDPDKLTELAGRILSVWQQYSDESAYIYAFSNDIPHNTVTPIARMREGRFELDLVLRNNITTPEHPDGLFHPHAELHNIKKENIGLIEVMGLAILPARLKQEMQILKDELLAGREIGTIELVAKHAQWCSKWRERYSLITDKNIDDVIKTEIGNTFLEVLQHAGVFKRDAKGQDAFECFIRAVHT